MTHTERAILRRIFWLCRVLRRFGLWVLGGIPRDQYESLPAKLAKAEEKAERFERMELGQRSEIVELERFIKRHGLGLKWYVERSRKRQPGGLFWWERKQKAS